MHVLGADGLCRFPHFLFPVPRGRRLTYVWTTEARYSGAASPVTDSRLRGAASPVTDTRLHGSASPVADSQLGGAASPVADTQLEVTVRDGDTLVTKLRHVGGQCAQQSSNITCLHREFPRRPHREFLYQRRCLERSDDDDKFFVEHNDGMCVCVAVSFSPKINRYSDRSCQAAADC